MKKLSAIILSLALMLTSVSAFASGRTYNLTEEGDALNSQSEINILYNYSFVQYEDVRPVNENDRVMIPFRAVLEAMGANVAYDDASRLVTASKNDRTITFTLMDDTIYIDENGAQSTMKMDVPMIIRQDRVLVPIRFMSEALGMQVGWDGDMQTVLVMDYADCFSELKTAAPNLTALMSLETPEYTKSTASANLNVHYGDEIIEARLDIAASGNTAEITLNGTGMGMTFSDAKIELIIDGETAYIKTDLVKQMGMLDELPLFTDENKWYKVNLAEIAEALGMDKTQITALLSSLKSNNTDISSVLASMFDSEDDATIFNAAYAAALLDTYEAMDKYITVETKDNGGYTASISINEEQFAEILIDVLMQGATDEEKQGFKEEMTTELRMSVSASADSDGKTEQSSAAISLSDENNISVSLDITQTSEIGEETAAELPTDAADITALLAQAISEF